MKSPIFIVGCGHSGTSILARLLGNHPNIYTVPHESSCAIGPDEKLVSALSRFNIAAAKEGKERWVEKTPKHIYKIGHILTVIPDAKILLIIRDGRDVAYSIGQRNKDKSEGYTEGITRWVKDNSAGKQYWYNKNVKIFKYEKLVKSFKEKMTDILLFLDEKYDDSMLNYHEKPVKWYSGEIVSVKPKSVDEYVAHNANRNWQINQPLYDGSNKWKMFSEDDLKNVMSIGHDLLKELSYI